MVNALGQITTHGTAVRNTDKEGHDSVVSECRTRKATPEELERYFGGPDKRPAPVKNVMSKDALRERLHPPAHSRKVTIDDVIDAASKVDKKQYKAMKAAVMIIEKLNGWDKEAE